MERLPFVKSILKMEYLIWVDEAWRGPWAWPVSACAFLFLQKSDITKSLRDSKKLSKKQREKIFEELITLEKSGWCLIWKAMISNTVIDKVWIKEANRLAMKKSLEELMKKSAWIKISEILIDWRDNYRFEKISIKCTYIIRWDDKIDEIKAASIIAKVSRDREMLKLSKKYPGYHFEVHSWYWTKKHRDAIEALWVCPIHRRSYAPIKKALILSEKS